MSYLVLARKSRPQVFEEVVGQKPVVKTLQNSLKRNRVAHAILFSGVRGVGKTTLARLMAKALNCEEGPTPTPCNRCSSCIQIVSGSSLDLHEIDGASNRGIQEVRELKEKIKFMPSSSRYKIVIIDEVHMLTTEAFNALLKTLEEPPEHVYFMFATTEIHKIPITILSRCQRYELQRVQSEELSQHFTKLAAQEGIAVEKSALSLIVREAEGSVRDGLSLLDQVFSYGESPITAEDVVEVLGLVNREVLSAIATALLENNKSQAIENLAETFRFGMDITRFMSDLLEYFRSLLLVKIKGCDKLLDLSENDIHELQLIAKKHSEETIHQKLCLLMQTAEDIRNSLQPRLVMETSFLSIIETDNIVPVSTLLGQLDTLLSALPPETAKGNSSSQVPAEATDPKKKIDAPQEAREKTASGSAPPDFERQNDLPPWETENFPPPVERSGETPSPSVPETALETSPEESQPSARRVKEDWLEFIAYIKERKTWMAQNLQQATGFREQGSELILEFDSSSDYTLLGSVENRKILTQYALNFFQKDYVIHFVTPEETEDPLKKASEGPKKQRQRLASHPLVRMTEEIFGGHVGDIRIGPRNHK